MNREIEYIQNVTAYCTLDATGAWTHSGGLPSTPDECVIRQITYSSADAAKGVYLIQTSLSNIIVGAVSNIPGFTSCPQTRIQLHSPVQPIRFQLLVPLNPPVPATDCTGDFIAISMDFIKYRR